MKFQRIRPRIFWDISIFFILLDEVCVLSKWSISFSKGTELLSLYAILPNFIKIGQELSELWLPQTHRQTDRQIHADENNTSPKTKFLGEVKIEIELKTPKYVKLSRKWNIFNLSTYDIKIQVQNGRFKTIERFRHKFYNPFQYRIQNKTEEAQIEKKTETKLKQKVEAFS